MSRTPSTFVKAPKRKPATARRVILSDEAKKAYEEMIMKRDAEQAEYRRHLDPSAKRV
jgi:hypothetical protein